MPDFVAEFRKRNNTLGLMRFSDEGKLIGEVEIRLERRRDPRNKDRAFMFGDLQSLSDAVKLLQDAKGGTGKTKAPPKARRVDAKRGSGGSVRGDGYGTTGSPDDSVSPEHGTAGGTES